MILASDLKIHSFLRNLIGYITGKSAGMYFILACPIILAMCLGCNHPDDEITDSLDNASTLMEASPEEALDTLMSIDTTKLVNNNLKARFSLLHAMALEKSSIYTTDTRIIAPALKYYISHGPSDNRLKSYYYYGRILMNGGDLPGAKTAFLQASEDSSNVMDRKSVARLLSAQAAIYQTEYKIKEYTQAKLRCADILLEIGDSIPALLYLEDALIGYVILEQKGAADRLFYRLMQLSAALGPDINPSVSNILPYIIDCGSPESLQAMLDDCMKNPDELSFADNLSIASGYVKLKNPEMARQALRRLQVQPTEGMDSATYYGLLSDIAVLENDYQEAYINSVKFNNSIEKRHEFLYEHPQLLFSERRYNMNKDHRKATESISVTILFMMLGIGCLIAVNLWMRNKMKQYALKIRENNLIKWDLKLSIMRKLRRNSDIAESTKELEEKHKQLRDRVDELIAKKLEEDSRLHQIRVLINRVESDIKELENGNNLRDCQLEKLRKDFAQTYYRHRPLLPEERRFTLSALKLLNDTILMPHSSDNSTFLPYIQNPEAIAFPAFLFVKILYPHFLKKMENHGLSESELRYVCLIALGFSIANAGQILKIKRVYHINNDLRKKLNIPAEDSTYLTRIIRNMLNERLAE